MSDTLEIAACAIFHKGEIYSDDGTSHTDMMENLNRKSKEVEPKNINDFLDAMSKGQKGFLLSDGTFATRERALAIAETAGQLKPSKDKRYSLYSYDLNWFQILKKKRNASKN